MADFASPEAGLAQGLQGGVNMGLQIDQAQRARKSQDWENDYRMMSTGLTLAKTKGMSPESQAKILNQSVAPVWKKWTGQDFPQIDPKNVNTFSPIVKNAHDLGTQASEGKISWSAAFGEIQNQVAKFHTDNQLDSEALANQQKAEEAAIAPIKGGYDTEQSAAKKKAADAKTPDEIMKEMFDTNKSVVGMQQLDQQTANLLQISPGAAKNLVGSRLTPAQLDQIKGIASARMIALNDALPAEKKLTPITEQEHKAMLARGVPEQEIFQKSFIVQGKSGH